jgi:hypothetical protein
MPLLPSWAWWVTALSASVGCAILTLATVQGAATFVAVATVVALYLRHRRAGLVGMWLLWLLVPALRRILGLSEGFETTDPLAIAPFLATGIIGAVELRRSSLSVRAKRIIFLACAALVFGIPVGLFANPEAMAFALFAYGAAIVTFAVGYNEPQRQELSLVRVLAYVAPAIAVYAMLQKFSPLPAWDDAWLKSSDFISVGRKEDGTLRSFATLNSPGTLAVVLGIAVVGLLTIRRFTTAHAAAVVVILGGISVTMVRSVWIGLVVALVALVLVAPNRLGRRAALVGVAVALALPFVAGTPIAHDVGERATTLTDVQSDTSAQERIATPSILVPIAIQQPLGVGLGQAGEASRLGDRGGLLRAPDNAFLSLVLQVGPVGLLLTLGAVGVGIASALRATRRRRTVRHLTLLGTVVLLGVLMITADVFYGVSGVILWYALGAAVRADELTKPTRTRQV